MPLTVLHRSAAAGNVRKIRKLVKAGASVDAPNITGSTALHVAAGAGRDKAVKALVALGADVARQDDNGDTALCIAARYGFNESIAVLCRSGADVDAPNAKGETPLCVAASSCSAGARTVTALLARGASASYALDGALPLHRAAFDGDPEKIRVLACAKGSRKALQASASSPRSALMVAAENGHAGALRVLLDLTPDNAVHQENGGGVRPLHLAAEKGHAACVRLLLDAGAAPDARVNRFGRAAFHLALKARNADTLRLLSGAGAQINITDDRGKTPLLYALETNDFDLIDVLLEIGANPDATGCDQTPLCNAARWGNDIVIGRLLEGGAVVNSPDGTGMTALEQALDGGHEMAVAALLAGGANVELVPERKRTKKILKLARAAGFSPPLEETSSPAP